MNKMDKLSFKNSNAPELLFRPVSEGLGFHPFSDGLPYAPIGKGQISKAEAAGQSLLSQSLGSGAVAAGLPKPVLPTNKSSVIPQISVPVVNPIEAVRKDIHSQAHSRHRSASAQTAQVSSRVPNAGLKPIAQPESIVGYGYLVRRCVAYFLDFFVNASICLGVVGFVVWIQDVPVDSIVDSGALLALCLFIIGFHWSIVMIQEMLFKTSLGKKLFGLSFRASSIVLFLRGLFFFPSIAFFGLGLLVGLVDRRKRCLHDWMSGAQPIERVRL